MRRAIARRFAGLVTVARFVFAACALVLPPRFAGAEEPSRPPLPESLLTESATDVDAAERGELEFEANLSTVAARADGARTTMASAEVEWRALANVGVRVEPSYARIVDAKAASVREVFGVSGALALGLFHDFESDLHLQGEFLGRTPDTRKDRGFEPGETELPAAADLVAALRRGRWTLRATIGAEAGGSFAHAPLHTDLAILTGVLPLERFGIVGLEARADWAREMPFVIAPEFVADMTRLGFPLRLGVALPVNIGADAAQASYGMFVRLIVLTSRELEYGRTGGYE